ncbi:hypothetical protein QYF61_010073 [Mycteria americana]|uniref:Uncharacterized protein n=1 Tax=Mycteria americana TaxID=33587 RepID=A0AAN7PI82_MYCAM|nr:hypothetical protein QYF61_010073 [Mycteria americana]
MVKEGIKDKSLRLRRVRLDVSKNSLKRVVQHWHREEIKYSKSWLTVAVKTASAREGKEHKQSIFHRAKQPQFPQPLPISLVLQTLHQLRCPSLDTLQPLNVSLVVRGPKLNTVFEVIYSNPPAMSRDIFH